MLVYVAQAGWDYEGSLLKGVYRTMEEAMSSLEGENMVDWKEVTVINLDTNETVGVHSVGTKEDFKE